jgi:hypothetical protein
MNIDWQTFFLYLFAAAVSVTLIATEYMRKRANAFRPPDKQIPLFVMSERVIMHPFSSYWGIFDGYSQIYPNSRLPLLVKISLVIPYLCLLGVVLTAIS